MKKVRFELEVNEVIEHVGGIPCDHECFKGEDKDGKIYLFIDRLTGAMCVISCEKGVTDKNKCAQFEAFHLPINAKITTEKEDTADNDIFAHVSACCDKIRKGMVDLQNDISVYIGQEFDDLKKESLGGYCISEKTLLNALEIVTKSRKE